MTTYTGNNCSSVGCQQTLHPDAADTPLVCVMRVAVREVDWNQNGCLCFAEIKSQVEWQTENIMRHNDHNTALMNSSKKKNSPQTTNTFNSWIVAGENCFFFSAGPTRAVRSSTEYSSIPPCHRSLAPNHKENSNKNIKCLHSHFLEVTNNHFAWCEDLMQSLKPWEREKWRLHKVIAVIGLWKQILILLLLFSNDLWLSYCYGFSFFAVTMPWWRKTSTGQHGLCYPWLVEKEWCQAGGCPAIPSLPPAHPLLSQRGRWNSRDNISLLGFNEIIAPQTGVFTVGRHSSMATGTQKLCSL